MTRRRQRHRIRRLAESFVEAKARFTMMDTTTDEDPFEDQRDDTCGETFAYRARLIAAVLQAVGRDLDSDFWQDGPAVVDVGGLIVAVAEGPENEGIREQAWDPSVIVFRKDQIVRLGRDIVRA